MSASTLIDWLAIGSWTSAAVFQIGTVLRDGWKLWKSRRRSTNRMQEIERRFLEGESMNGWRRIIPNPADGIQYAYDSDVYIVAPVIGNRDPEGGQGGDGFSLDFLLTSSLIGGRTRIAWNFHRCSRFRPSSTLLLKIIYDRDQWQGLSAHYVDSITVASLFKQEGTENFKIVFLNVKTRQVRQVMVEAPIEGSSAHFADLSTSPKSQVRIMYEICEDDDDGNWYLHLIDSTYDLPPVDTPSSSIIRPSSWESISIPLGNRRGRYAFGSIWACVMVFFDESDAETDLCISVDNKMKWHIDMGAAWQSSYRNTKMGECVLNAIRGMAALVGDSLEDPPLPYHRPFTPSLGKNEILMQGSGWDSSWDQLGILQRRLALCFLKSSAVEAVCMGYPDVKMSAVQEATGVDVSDGIVEDGDGQGEGKLIYL